MINHFTSHSMYSICTIIFERVTKLQSKSSHNANIVQVQSKRTSLNDKGRQTVRASINDIEHWSLLYKS